VQAADQKVFHDASLSIKTSMNVNVSGLQARGEIRPRGKVIAKFKLDPPRVDVFMLSRIVTLLI